MTTTYQPLFKVGVQHAYYKQLAAAGDFAIRPSQATAALMRRHRLRFNGYNTPADAGFDIYFAASSGRTPERELPSDFRMGFHLALKDTSLLNVSDLDAPGPGKVHYYGLTELSSSPTLSSILPPQTVAVKGSQFMHRFSRPSGLSGLAGPEMFQVRDARNGSIIASYTVQPDALGNYSVELRLHELPEGLYTFFYRTFSTLNESFYLSDEVKANPVFAVAEISQASGAWDYNAIPAYYLQLASRQAVWHYWLAREGEVAITYEDLGSGAFGPYPAHVYLHPATALVTHPYAYLGTSAYADTLARLQARYPTAAVELWITADHAAAASAQALPLPHYELPRAGMALMGTALGDYHFSSLPVPSRKRVGTDIVLFLYEGEIVVLS